MTIIYCYVGKWFKLKMLKKQSEICPLNCDKYNWSGWYLHRADK